jgi:large subunit ribosomal protein L17
MRHHSTARKFGRPASQRAALLRSLSRALILHGKIETTQAKAKELRGVIEKMITKSNLGTPASYRLILSRLGNEERVAKKLRDEVAPKYKDRNGGYTRIIKIHKRSHDARDRAVIEFV